MAGIGFRLEKILSRDSYSHLLKGYGYSAVVSAGPLLCSVFSIALLVIIAPRNVSSTEILVFRTLVVYAFGLSLIATSPAQMVITRYMADRIFLNDMQALIPALVGLLAIMLPAHAVLGALLIPLAKLSFAASATAVLLFLLTGIIWIAMIALSAAKEFIWIVQSFFAGAIVSVAAGHALSSHMGFLGLLGGFTLGQALLATLLVVQIFVEFDFRRNAEFDFLDSFRCFPGLAFIATLYNIGIWADKVIFWFSPQTGIPLHAELRISPVYDVPVFVAYLLVIPSLAMFTVRIETDFYVHYKKYFLSILNKHPLSSLEERRQNIVNTLRQSMGRLLALQGAITAIALFAAPMVSSRLGMTPINLHIFQVAILATFLQAMLQPLLLIMLYFDFRSDAVLTAAIFAATNIVLTHLSILWGPAWYGYGYFGSCLLSLAVGYVIFNARLKRLLFYTFTNQKVIVHKEIADEA